MSSIRPMPPLPPAPPAWAYAKGPAAAAVGLTVLAIAVGAVGWGIPDRTLSGWQVADVPGGLFVVVAVLAPACTVVAVVVSRPWRWRTPLAAATWLVLVLGSAFAGAWNSLFFAALSDGDNGPIIPIFDGFFTFVPALVIALMLAPRGRAVQLQAGIGTAVVSLPFVALGWALPVDSAGWGSAAVSALFPTAFFGIASLAAALALTVATNPRH